jgi:hypothetical protein
MEKYYRAIVEETGFSFNRPSIQQKTFHLTGRVLVPFLRTHVPEGWKIDK